MTLYLELPIPAKELDQAKLIQMQISETQVGFSKPSNQFIDRNFNLLDAFEQFGIAKARKKENNESSN